MANRKTLTVALMDPPLESANTTTAMRIITEALKKGHNVNVWTYEGAVSMTMKGQQQHPNPVKGTSVEQEQHPLTKDWVASLFKMATGDQKIEWVNCGLCVDERGAGDWIDGPRRGTPADLVKFIDGSDKALVIPTK